MLLLHRRGAGPQGVPLFQGVEGTRGTDGGPGHTSELGEDVVCCVGHHEVLHGGVLLVEVALEVVAEVEPARVGIEGGLQADGSYGDDR